MAAITGCAYMPSTITGNGFVAGLQGLAITNATSGGQFTNPEAVGEWGACLVAANNGRCENADQVLANGSLTGVVLYGREISTLWGNTTDTGAGLYINNGGSNVQPTNFPALLIQPSGSAMFTSGISIPTGAIKQSAQIAPAVVLGTSLSGASKISQLIRFTATDGSSVAQTGDIVGVVDGANFKIAVFNSTHGQTGFSASYMAVSIFTVSTLPAASNYVAGQWVEVSDATSFTPGTCTGGGSDYMIAISNGSTWSCH
jgi:hypothetical protein